jgi:hypothetical protein
MDNNIFHIFHIFLIINSIQINAAEENTRSAEETSIGYCAKPNGLKTATTEFG